MLQRKQQEYEWMNEWMNELSVKSDNAIAEWDAKEMKRKYTKNVILRAKQYENSRSMKKNIKYYYTC
jgi:hypothetical protein